MVKKISKLERQWTKRKTIYMQDNREKERQKVISVWNNTFMIEGILNSSMYNMEHQGFFCGSLEARDR